MGSSFDSATLLATVFLGFLVFPILYYIGRAIAGKRLKIRQIAGLAAIDEAVGRATEMGRPISFCTGLGGVDLPTLAAVAVMGHVARLSARYDNEIYIPMRDPVLMGVGTEVCREAYRSEGKPDAFDPGEHMRFLSGNQFAYASGIMGMMHRKKVAANFMFGSFAAESLILAEAGQQIGAIQVAGTISYTQIPFFIEISCICLTALIALAVLTAFNVSSKFTSLRGVNNAIGLPLFVITISCSSGNCFHIWAGAVLISLTVTNFMILSPHNKYNLLSHICQQ